MSLRPVLRFTLPLFALTALVACQAPAPRQTAGPFRPAPVQVARIDPQSEAVMMALAMIGTPYRFGGNTLGGFDCSGLTSWVYSQSMGLTLPHSALEQSELGGKPLRRPRQLRSGDLVFFETLPERISHVGLYVGEGRFVHAPSTGSLVRIDRIDDSYWGPRFRFGKRLQR